MTGHTKIAFIGTACSGKTTLLQLAQGHFGLNAGYVEEVAREYFSSRTVPVHTRLSVGVQGELMQLIEEREKEVAAQTPPEWPIFCDRSVADAPVYVRAGGDIAGALRLLEAARPWLATYSRLFLMDPTDIPYETDDVRTESAATRDHIHATFISFLSHKSIEFELLSGSPSDRLQRVLGEVG